VVTQRSSRVGRPCWLEWPFEIETQTTIQAFLEGKGLKVGTINGSFGQRNQNTIARFWKNPPDCHVIVSTEGGSQHQLHAGQAWMSEYVGPRAPKLPPVVRAMDAREFALAALTSFGAEVTPQKGQLYLVEEDGGREWIRFDESARGEPRATLYAPSSRSFLAPREPDDRGRRSPSTSQPPRTTLPSSLARPAFASRSF